MIDTHAHINTEKFDEDRSDVIQRALDSGVKKIVIPAIEPKDFKSLLELVQSHEELYCGIGVHPHNVSEIGQNELDLVDNLSSQDKVVAIGEIGIDYYYDFAPKEIQKEMFDSQIKIALEKDVPIIVHNREADDDVLDIIQQNQQGDLRGVLHCFSSELPTLKRALDQGMLVSFTGNITFKKSTLDEVVKYVPLDRVMIETDSPYITPVPYRGKRNEPSYVKYVAEKIAQLKDISINEVIEMTSKNAERLFRFSSLLILFSIFSFSNSYAQDDDYYDDEYYEDEEYIEEDLEPYYNKFIGVGGIFGVNTIVEVRLTETNDREEISYEGLPAFGGEIAFYPFEYLFIKAGYLTSINTKTVDNLRERGVENLPEPNTNQLIEFSINATPNPNGIINFYGILGYSLITNTNYFQEEGSMVYSKNVLNVSAVNYGIGLMTNFDFGSGGVLSLSAEVKFNYEIGTVNQNVWVGLNSEGQNIFRETELYNIFSIPRVSLMYFPSF